MFKLLVFVHLILGLITLKLNAQNLVPNYSFENYTTCPTGSSQIGYAIPWTSVYNNNLEYYNSCATPCLWSVPCQTSASYQYAKTGNAFVGLWLLNSYGSNYREYLQIELSDSLYNGTCYRVSFFANNHNSIKYAINNIGLYLSSNYYVSAFGGELLSFFNPQILGFKNEIINDTLDWIEISGIYTANGGENYLIIGNFFDDANTDTLDTGNGTYSSAYYYIDDVSVIPIDSMPGGMPAYAGADTNVISGDSVFIGQKISNLNCTWYDSNGVVVGNNTSGIYVNPTNSTYYVVEQNLCGVITYDTVNVTVLPTSVNELVSVNEVLIYPNPTTGELSIEMLHPSSEWQITILEVQGRTVLKKLVTSNKVNLKLELENGVYLV